MYNTRSLLAPLVFLLMISSINFGCNARKKQKALIEMSDHKELKQLLRTKTNVLLSFIASPKLAEKSLKVVNEAAEAVRGEGTMVLIDCSGTGKKLCKKMKASPEVIEMRHYKDGEFHKNYDRRETVASLVNFMRDPKGDLPWDEEPTAVDVVHLPNLQSLEKLLKKEKRGVMIMFYAPWCGFCKKMKPDYSEAATEAKEIGVMAAIDINRPENAIVRTKYNITGYPTLIYFENGAQKMVYEGDNTKDKLVAFMKDPRPPPRAVPPPEWADEESDVVHLKTDTFSEFIENNPSVLVMFYAPWCGHCKKLKPEYDKAATTLKELKLGVLAAVDATKEPSLASKFKVTGYPTIKYFEAGAFAYDTPSLRDSDKLVAFMRSPQQPPPPPPPDADWADQPSDVLHLSLDNYKPELRRKRHSLVMFYAPWCGHCKSAKPEFVRAAAELSDSGRMVLGAVDCTKEASLCKAHEVRGYPTFKYFHYLNKAVADYSGGRTANDFVKYMRNAEDNLKTLLDEPEKIKDEL
ncbi:hypothetical protein LSTR_LSTR006311 [Laodelphax striatellus]|uniref:Thioredoxin domain-containing protein n=1 Tax=Laodelphax striatellus TaxID=195883 RepID=A0A482XNE6_LAOST|nr:hypothetical protein LSTR_LSTR006311 [Laodelphax striatellus]